MDFFLQPMNLVLAVIAVVSGAMILWPMIAGANVPRVSPTQATQLINAKAQVIDVRPVEAYASGHINNAKSLPMANLQEQLGLTKLKKDKPVVVVCERGVTAAKAVGAIKQAGFENVYVLDGGLKAWRDEQLPLVK